MSAGGRAAIRPDSRASAVAVGPADGLLAGVIFLLAGLAYWQTLRFGLVSDDLSLFGGNYQLQSLRYLPSFFTGGVWDAVLHGKVDGALYRPLFLVYVTCLNLLDRGNAVALHAASVLLHAATSVLFFFLLRVLLPDTKRVVAAAGALLFALHPAHAGSVAWVSASPDLLAGLWLLASLLLYARGQRQGGAGLLLGLSFVAFVVALFCKETAIVFPLVIAGFDWLKRRFSLGRTAVFLGGSAFYYLCRLAALSGKTAQSLSLGRLDWGKFWYLVRFVPAYGKQLIWPGGQPFFLFASVDHYLAGLPLTFFGLASLLLFVLALLARPREALFAGAWLLLFLAPALALAFCNQPIFEVRYLYLPSMGFILLLTLIFEQVERRAGRGWLLAVTIPLLLAAGYVVSREIQPFRDGGALYARIISSSPASSKGYLCLAQEVEAGGDRARAFALLQKAQAVATGTEERLEANYELGMFLAQGRDPQAGLPYLKEAVRLDASYSAAYNAIGNIYLLLRQPGEAISYYRQAVESQRDNFAALFNLGRAYELTGATPQALACYRDLVARAPRAGYGRQVAHAEEFIRQAAGR